MSKPPAYSAYVRWYGPNGTLQVSYLYADNSYVAILERSIRFLDRWPDLGDPGDDHPATEIEIWDVSGIVYSLGGLYS